MGEMTVGALARKAGVNVETVRYYQGLGDPQSCGEARALAAEKLALVESRLRDLARPG